MSAKTKIEWADVTINPIVGCSRCSPGCDNCYAERFAARMAKHPNPKISGKYAGIVDEHGKWTGKINDWFEDFPELRRAKKPLRVFVGSMCDIFHENNTDLNIASLLNYVDGGIADYMGCSAEYYRRHTYLYLTKRPERMLEFYHKLYEDGYEPNLWLGVTVCNQAEAEAKVPILLSIPAAKRFVSVEPMLGPVDLSHMDADASGHEWCWINALTGRHTDMGRPCPDVPKLDWVICGGETGPNARTMNYAWVYKLAEQCWSSGTPFFFKSWGEWTPAFYQPDGGYKVNADAAIPHGFEAKHHIFPENPGIRMYKVGKRRSGRMLRDAEWNEVPV